LVFGTFPCPDRSQRAGGLVARDDPARREDFAQQRETAALVSMPQAGKKSTGAG
jgi:hypothetical protein